ncbi:RNA polymerase sigma factor [Marinobacter sp. X15-166B]|uniref:RNA polymerase sigma factor n=1 Tax=Marinobacter sp. X15-166B TaxID=1897620 RepID=UPI001D17489F|nr:sigma-70 family RNA polymerase sigma factor [Marinobacter sp. X15-166B]
MDPVMHQSDDMELVSLLKLGDAQAFQHTVRQYTPGMLAVARYYLDPSSAEDVVQDCWVSVVSAVKTFEGRSSLKTWLHRIVANRAKNQLRKARREVPTDFGDALDPELANRFKANGRWRTPPQPGGP